MTLDEQITILRSTVKRHDERLKLERDKLDVLESRQKAIIAKDIMAGGFISKITWRPEYVGGNTLKPDKMGDPAVKTLLDMLKPKSGDLASVVVLSMKSRFAGTYQDSVTLYSDGRLIFTDVKLKEKFAEETGIKILPYENQYYKGTGMEDQKWEDHHYGA